MDRKTWLARKALHDEWTFGDLNEPEIGAFKKGFRAGFDAARKEAMRLFQAIATKELGAGNMANYESMTLLAGHLRVLGDEVNE